MWHSSHTIPHGLNTCLFLENYLDGLWPSIEASVQCFAPRSHPVGNCQITDSQGVGKISIGKILPDITVVDGLLMDVRPVDEFCLLVSRVNPENGGKPVNDGFW